MLILWVIYNIGMYVYLLILVVKDEVRMGGFGFSMIGDFVSFVVDVKGEVMMYLGLLFRRI